MIDTKQDTCIPKFIQHWGGTTFYHVDDLPFGKQEKEQEKDSRDMILFPSMFTIFRKIIENDEKCQIKEPLPIPNKNSMVPHIPPTTTATTRENGIKRN